MLPILFALVASGPMVVVGDAAFSYRVREAADNRGITLADPGCAVLDCSLIGTEAWVLVGRRWVGPLTVVDCAATRDRAFWRERGRAVDLPWSLWRRLGLPLAPHPVVVAFMEPNPGPRWD